VSLWRSVAPSLEKSKKRLNLWDVPGGPSPSAIFACGSLRPTHDGERSSKRSLWRIAHLPPNLQIGVNLEKRVARAGEAEAQDFRIDYQSEAPKAQPKLEVTEVLPQVQLTMLRGHTTKKTYRFAKSKINLGRLAEVLDDHYRVVRRNDLVFQESGDDTDQTVSREHAHISFNEKPGEFRLYDDGSAYGTRILRDGQTIEVQASNRRGAKLHPGDEVFLGQACIRFDIQKQRK
jgi:hypothetical protein